MNILGMKISVEREASRGSKWTRRAAAIGVASGVLFSGGVAYAFWSVTGSGNGTAAAGSASPLTITAGSAPGSLLVPGGQADVKLVITNKNKANVSISALTLSNTGIAGYTDNTFGTAKTGCTATGVSWTSGAGSHTLSSPIVVGANGGTYTLTLTNGAQMSTSSDDGCQNAVFNMPVSGVTAVVTSDTASSPTNGSSS